MKGCIHIYTGNGKGKTTAAFGQALRAVGAGMKVFIAQFVKGKSYSEIEAVEEFLPSIKIKQYGLGCFIVNEPTQKDIDAARAGLLEVSKIMQSGEYEMIILDEANIALYYKLFTVEELTGVLDKKKDETEIIITGRYAPEKLIEYADLVSDMREVKHYYQRGIEARKGIEY